jgi:hypothetical protein
MDAIWIKTCKEKTSHPSYCHIIIYAYEVYPTFLVVFEQNLMFLIDWIGITCIVDSLREWEFKHFTY